MKSLNLGEYSVAANPEHHLKTLSKSLLRFSVSRVLCRFLSRGGTVAITCPQIGQA